MVEVVYTVALVTAPIPHSQLERRLCSSPVCCRRSPRYLFAPKSSSRVEERMLASPQPRPTQSKQTASQASEHQHQLLLSISEISIPDSSSTRVYPYLFVLWPPSPRTHALIPTNNGPFRLRKPPSSAYVTSAPTLCISHAHMLRAARQRPLPNVYFIRAV